VILTESETLPLIKKGTTYHAEWDNVERDFVAEQDRLVVPLGTYYNLQKEARECVR